MLALIGSSADGEPPLVTGKVRVNASVALELPRDFAVSYKSQRAYLIIDGRDPDGKPVAVRIVRAPFELKLGDFGTITASDGELRVDNIRETLSRITLRKRTRPDAPIRTAVSAKVRVSRGVALELPQDFTVSYKSQRAYLIIDGRDPDGKPVAVRIVRAPFGLKLGDFGTITASDGELRLDNRSNTLVSITLRTYARVDRPK